MPVTHRDVLKKIIKCNNLIFNVVVQSWAIEKRVHRERRSVLDK